MARGVVSHEWNGVAPGWSCDTGSTGDGEAWVRLVWGLSRQRAGWGAAPYLRTSAGRGGLGITGPLRWLMVAGRGIPDGWREGESILF